MSQAETKKSSKVGAKRYSPTTVRRSILKDGRWEEIERYDDATVVGLGRHGLLNCDEAQLRAYSPDPEDDLYGDERERQGAGVHLNESDYYGDEMKGYVLDCDGDVALKRIVMNGVLKIDNWGHGDFTYTGVVSFEDIGVWGSGTREVNDWTGRGDLENVRLERWDVRLAKSAGDED